jgi:hypothetical protein
MKTLTLFLILILLAGSPLAQKTALIFTVIPGPEVDGFMEELWDACNSIEKIDVPFKTEVASIGNSTWRGLWDGETIYFLVTVEDDNHWPAWKAGNANTSEYDKPEFYFDVNSLLKDGVGARTSNSGHYQLSPGFAEGSYDMAITQAQSAPGNNNPGGTWAYSQHGEGYVYEISIPLTNLTDKFGGPFTWVPRIGFDITIIDQDGGITTARQRMNWNNAGAIDECWNNMDDAGFISFYDVGIKELQKQIHLSVYPNPVQTQAAIRGVVVDRVQLFNNLGIKVKETTVRNEMISVEGLPNGVYIMKAYKNGKFEGVARIVKE